jgi:phosphoglycolate phosphatase-like HAD superfamily hydrolase
MKITFRQLISFTLVAALTLTTTIAFTADPSTPIGAGSLPSWNEGLAKQAIIEFVKVTTDQANPKFVPPEARIAVFDQDGTTWVEQPLYTQLMFAFHQVGVMAKKDPKLAEAEPFKTVLSGDRSAISKLTIKDLEKILFATHTGMTVEAFQASVKEWIATAKDPRWKRPYTELVYQPMLEVMRYLRDNGYKTYIVTGGGQDFVRVFSEQVYGILPEQVVGSAADTKFGYDKNGKATLTKVPKVVLVDDKAGKPTGIHLMIGRRPVVAFGNSGGDQQMLDYTQAGDGARLMMLVYHDDDKREYAYGPKSKVGTFPDTLMAEAKKKGWTVISMKNDWKRVFPFEQ